MAIGNISVTIWQLPCKVFVYTLFSLEETVRCWQSTQPQQFLAFDMINASLWTHTMGTQNDTVHQQRIPAVRSYLKTEWKETRKTIRAWKLTHRKPTESWEWETNWPQWILDLNLPHTIKKELKNPSEVIFSNLIPCNASQPPRSKSQVPATPKSPSATRKYLHSLRDAVLSRVSCAWSWVFVFWPMRKCWFW